ncbi:maleate cis-trans isomerase family protein [Sporosarcina cascadiensis]|uniref:maleate cis-trans isomerase family protein n=1 Tax=Sporosarcina cascadiensis TaxID=2660747 RepID=UPI00129BD860|nr:Asp/Glu racemase [Sporosarcina cascadiensis]
MDNNYRVGLIVPSSNTTMETEIPAMLQERMKVKPETFTFHSARMRMKNVTPEELKKMDIDSDRCALELSDARCDVLAYACLVAIMCQGAGYHNVSEKRLSKAVEENGGKAPVVSSAGALIDGIKLIGAKKVAIITPYMRSLTDQVIEYLNGSGIEVVDSISLEVADNLEVGRLDPKNLIQYAEKLNIEEADAIVLSACVQMPSLPSIQEVENRLGLPVLSAATSTVYKILTELNLDPVVPNAGKLLSGDITIAVN